MKRIVERISVLVMLLSLISFFELATASDCSHVCSVVDETTNTVAFNYTIPSFMVNDSICDCCDCSDEANGSGANFCNELLHEYNSVLVDQYWKQDVLPGKQKLFEIILRDNVEYISAVQKLKNLEELLLLDKYKFTDLDLVQEVKTLINEYLTYIMSFSDSPDDYENLDALNSFFEKQLPIILANDHSPKSENLIMKQHHLINTKALVNKYHVIKLFCVSVKEEESGIEFKHYPELLELNPIIEAYGDLYFNSNSLKNKIKSLLRLTPKNDAVVKKLQIQKDIKDLQIKIKDIESTFSNEDKKNKIHDYFQNDNETPLISQYGKYEYILTPEKQLYQKPLNQEDENVYLIGNLRSLNFIDDDDSSEKESIVKDIIWKDIQNRSTNYLDSAIPDSDSDIFKEIMNLNNGMTMKFLKGHKCWNGPRRSALVKLHCSSHVFQIVDVIEFSKCGYIIEADSIFGCM